VRRGRKAAGLNSDKMAELPDEVMPVCAAFLFAGKEVTRSSVIPAEGIGPGNVAPDNG